MFTGIIEAIGIVTNIESDRTNKIFTIASPISNELKIDQSVSHHGVCLTVTNVEKGSHTVCAIHETLSITNLGQLEIGSPVNLERCLTFNGRIDGHIVQGHVDQTGECVLAESANGSWVFGFEYDPSKQNITVSKGSICINGVSLTVVESHKGYFSVAIIPYTYENTTFSDLKKGSLVNLEFDIIGKYISKFASEYIH
ncbi:MAG: riboflavin synthase [Cytophagales bacterium]|nr:riboflavin synthase [Cytophagales bacterium]